MGTRLASPIATPAAFESLSDKNMAAPSGTGAVPNRLMSLGKSLSFKERSRRIRSGSFGSKEKSSLFASFSGRKSSNVAATTLNRDLLVLDLSKAGSDSLGTTSSENNKHDDSVHMKIGNREKELGATAKTDMACPLKYDSQEEDRSSSEQDDERDDYYLPNKDVPSISPPALDFSHTTSTSFEEVEGSTVMTDPAIMLSRLGADATDDKMAEVASTRIQESINDCFTVGAAGLLDRRNFDKIPSYAKGELLIGQYLGKGSFSDVFEVTVTVRDPVECVSTVDEVVAAAANEMAFNNENESVTLPNEDSVRRKRPVQQRCHSLNSSTSVSSLGTTAVPVSSMGQEKRLTLAMKCLRPQVRSSFDHFLIGVKDLVHETAILSSLDHPNIIKLHGRAGDNSLLKLSDGYFILVDRLQDTLQDKVNRWAKSFPNSCKKSPSLNQIKVACALSDALSYLHLSNVVFRDLKPANVGFDSSGTLKLFDFGFAVSISSDNSQGSNLLNDKCGTLRYMAPEVGSGQGYGVEVDVYSFGIVLWEICALKKPFSSIKSAGDFENRVFDKGERPKLGKYWPKHLTDTLQRCWSSDPKERPTMQYVKSMLTASVNELKSQPADASGVNSLKKSFVRQGSLRGMFNSNFAF